MSVYKLYELAQKADMDVKGAKYPEKKTRRSHCSTKIKNTNYGPSLEILIQN